MKAHTVSVSGSVMPRWSLLVFFALVLTTLSGCLGAKHPWRADSVTTEEVRILPKEIYQRKNRLFVRVTVFNLGANPITVVRDSVKAQLMNGPNQPGPILDRSVGMTSTHMIYTIPPGGNHAVDVDFKNDAILNYGAANVFWTGAVFDGARQLMIPATPVQVNGL